MWGPRSSRTVVVGTATIIFVVSCVLPVAYMVGLSLAGTPQVGSNFTALLLDARQRGLLFNTTVLGCGTALLGTVIGAPLGFALARVDLPFKATLRTALATPMLLPPYVVALAWISLGRRGGLVTQIAGRDALSNWTYSAGGAVVVLSLVFYPLSMLATEVAVRRIEPRLEEAAALVARPRRVLWRITMRLAAPSITAAALVIFALAISEFGVPGLLRVRVFATEVFTAFAALYDFGRATALALPLLLLSILVATLAIMLVGERLIATRRALPGVRPLLFDRWKAGVTLAITCVAVLALVVPLGALAREALGTESWAAIVEGSRAAVVKSLVVATVGATLTVVLGLWLGYARARARRRFGFMADLVFVVLFAVPSTVVGVGLIGLWNRPGVMGSLYGTDAMLVLVCLARFLPVAALGLAATVRYIPLSHEEAAAASGAGWVRTMTHIVVPQMTIGLASVWVVVFVLAFGELGASILVAPPGEATLPIRIYTLIANAPPARVAALALLQSAIIVAPLACLAWAVAARETR